MSTKLNIKRSHTKHTNRLAKVKNGVATISNATSNGLTSALKSTRQLATTVRGKAVTAAKATDKSIRENPYKAAGVAVGVGALLGLFLARRRAASKAD